MRNAKLRLVTPAKAQAMIVNCLVSSQVRLKARVDFNETQHYHATLEDSTDDGDVTDLVQTRVAPGN